MKMGKSSKQQPNAGTAASKAASKATGSAPPTLKQTRRERPEDIMTVLISATPLAAAVIGLAWGMGEFGIFHSTAEGRTHILVRLIFFLVFDAAFARNLAELFVLASRPLSRLLPGAVVPPSPAKCAEEEQAQHDPSLVWPPTSAALPAEWVKSAASRSPKRRQPYFLNHMRGCVRLRQAALRLGAAAGTLAQVYFMSMLLDKRSLSVIGLPASPLDIVLGRDLWLGVLTGAACVIALFVVEVALGWVKVIGIFETVAPGESLPLNLLWDILFHAGVAVNEEVSMRGWMLLNIAQAFVAHLGISVASAGGLSVGLQSALFAIAHLNSPGASSLGLINLMIGGGAGALNVFLSGGLAFPLGWHFGWNLLMGHLLGLSTSGIPMSSKLISVVPHPDKAALHGGQFGPEQSPLAPFAYLLGCALLVYFYGDSGIDEWRQQLTA